MKKIWKMLAGLVAILLIGLILFMTNAFVGNPISKALAHHSVEKYIAATYPGQGYEIEKIGYNFKLGNYMAHIVKPGSLDRHFTVEVSILGQIGYDRHDHVTKGWNTFERINGDYRQMVDRVLDGPEYPLTGDIKFGQIREINEVEVGFEGEEAYGLDMGTLEVDQTYDIKAIGKVAGRLTIYAEDEEISAAKAGEKLLALKAYLDQNDLPFYALDFVLEKPRKEGVVNPDGDLIQLENFPYRDIYEGGLAQRIQAADEKVKKSYEALDKEKSEF